MFEKVEKNQLGFYQIKDIPTKQELQEYYANKYYQDEDHYQHEYSSEELSYITNKIAQKYSQLTKFIEPTEGLRMLDIGCGEGWTLKYFNEKGWNVTGMDFSDFGVKGHNPELSEYVLKGDLEVILEQLVEKNEQFDLILTDNVVEHVSDPLRVVSMCYELTKTDGVLIIEVPNDFSNVQKHLFDNNMVSKPYWVAPPDHLSYFDKESLNRTCEEVGWKTLTNMADFPIELFLFNKHSNYAESPEVGKSCHLARVELENLFHEQGMEKVNKFYEAAADLGLGRVITGFYKKVSV